MSLEKYPLDFERLEKGSWIEGDALEAATPVPRGHRNWNLALVALCKKIQDQTGIVCRIDHERLRLMEDAEADEWNDRRAKQHVTGLVRCAARSALIDHGALDDEQRRLAEHRQRKQYAIAAAARSELRKQEALLKNPQEVKQVS